jgi:hypothetical protein
MEIANVEGGIETFEAFKALAGNAFAPYATAAVLAENLEKITAWSVANLPGGLAAATQVGFFDLGFRNCVAAGTLKRDPTWISWADRKKQLQVEHDQMTATAARERFKNDPEYARFMEGR